MSKNIAIIPARMGSTRFPGKPLARICGVPMIAHVWARTQMSKSIDATYIATCDREIFDYVESIGGKVVMTADTHERCSDRTAEALSKIEKELGEKAGVVVMVQGDEPFTHPQMINEALAPFADAKVQIVNLMGPIDTSEDFEDPNEVKVVVDLKDNALYFSREAIPSRKKGAKQVPMLKQICIIPFRRDFLLKFNELEPTPLEKIESVDMMRVLEHGYQVKMVRTKFQTVSVDTPEDLAFAESIMAKDVLFTDYRGLLK
jgi:3-deoxy-manno-octulosonate cytidylyltransferase (CMP-KDO synthetase)